MSVNGPTEPTDAEMREAWEEQRRVEAALADLGADPDMTPSEALRHVEALLATAEASIRRIQQDVAVARAVVEQRIEKLAKKRVRDPWLAALGGVLAGLVIGFIIHLSTLPGGGP